MTTVKAIEAAIPRLSRAEIEEIREWINDYLEDQLALSSEVTSQFDRYRSEASAGRFVPRQRN